MSKMDLLKELTKSDAVCVSAAVAAQVLGTTPQAVRMAARQAPEQLGFPTIVIKNRVMIPRLPFLEFVGVKQ